MGKKIDWKYRYGDTVGHWRILARWIEAVAGVLVHLHVRSPSGLFVEADSQGREALAPAGASVAPIGVTATQLLDVSGPSGKRGIT